MQFSYRSQRSLSTTFKEWQPSDGTSSSKTPAHRVKLTNKDISFYYCIIVSFKIPGSKSSVVEFQRHPKSDINLFYKLYFNYQNTLPTCTSHLIQKQLNQSYPIILILLSSQLFCVHWSTKLKVVKFTSASIVPKVSKRKTI